MLGLSVVFLAAYAVGIVRAVEYGSCQTNDCLKAVIGSRSQPCLYRCKSFMRATVTPAPSTVVSTVTVSTTDEAEVPITHLDTAYTTITETESKVATETSSVTATDYAFKTVTVTTTVTVDEPPNYIEYKRDFATLESATTRGKIKRDVQHDDEPKTRYPSCMARKFIDACGDAAAYSSACSCIGVTATTIYKPTPTITKTITKTDGITSSRTTTKATSTIPITDKTEIATVTYSTITVLTTVATVQSDIIVSTKTITSASTRAAPPSQPYETIYLQAFRQDVTPRYTLYQKLEKRIGVQIYYSSFRGNNPAGVLHWRLEILTGEMRVIRQGATGVAMGWHWTYSTQNEDPSSVVAAVERYEEEGGSSQRMVCRMVGGLYFNCMWGNEGDGVFWMCNGFLAFAREGWDESLVCPGAFKVDIEAVRV